MGTNFSNNIFSKHLRELNSQGDRFPGICFVDWENTQDRMGRTNWVIDLRLRAIWMCNP